MHYLMSMLLVGVYVHVCNSNAYELFKLVICCFMFLSITFF
jgi:hypothetical protein